MAISRSAWEQAKKCEGHMAALISYSSMEAAQQAVDKWLNGTKLARKVRIGVVAVFNDLEPMQLDAHAKVITPAGSFEHVEPYMDFPSDAFKAKVLLVTGG